MQNALMTSSNNELADIDWEEVSIRLAAYVSYRSRRWASAADVEEVVAETLCRVIDRDYKDWDPASEPIFLRFCISVANGVLRNVVRRSYRSYEKPLVPGQIETRPARETAAHRINVRDNGRAIARLRERASEDELVSKIIGLYADGVEKTRHLAAALNTSSTEVHNAKRRLLVHIEAIRVELRNEGSNE